MKPVITDTEVVSTLKGRTGALSIDEHSLAHIMDTLTNIYADAEMAVIREYPSNAWDSHRAAGQSRPIEVTLPNAFDSVFKVRDFGVGLSADEIFEIYGKYGASTKRTTNDEVGMLGIGAKAALTLVDQFTLRCVKDGMRCIANISAPTKKLEDDAVSEDIHVTEPVPTDEPDGVEVSIAIPDPQSFVSKAKQFFRCWDPADVLINGEPPEPLDGMWLDDDVLVLSERPFTHPLFLHDVIVMGNVPYPVNTGSFHGGIAESQTVAFVPIGTVEPTPNREALKDTRATTEVINSLNEFVVDRLFAYRQSQLDACATPYEAAKLHMSWGAPDPLRLRYHGRKIPRSISAEGFYYNPTNKSTRSHFPNRSRYNYYYADLDAIDRVCEQWGLSKALVVVTGHTNKSVHPSNRVRINRYLDAQGLNAKHGRYPSVLLVHSISKVNNLDWIDPNLVHVVDWEEIRAIKLPQAARQQRKGSSSSDHYVVTFPAGHRGDRQQVHKDELDGCSEVYYVTAREESEIVTAATASRILKAPVARLEANRVKKFRRLFPRARHAPRAVAELVHVAHSSLRPIEEAQLYGVFDSAVWVFDSVDAADVLDPEIRDVIKELSNLDDEKVDFIRSVWSLNRLCARFNVRPQYGRAHSSSTLRPYGLMLKGLEERYPFLRRIAGSVPEHDLIEYVNALYIYRNEA